MKSNLVEVQYRKGGWNSYLDNLLNETDWHKFLHKTISSEENPQRVQVSLVDICSRYSEIFPSLSP